MAKPETVTARVLDRLDTLHRKRRSTRVIAAVLWTFAIFLITSATALALDATFGWWSITTRSIISIAAFAMILIVFAYGLRWAVRRDDAATLASVADRRTPVMQERLQTIVSETETPDRHIVTDRLMLGRVAAETDELIDRFDPNVASHENSGTRPWIAIAIGFLMWIVLLIVVGSDTGVLLGRFLSPTSDLTRHRIEGLPGNQVIARGEPFEIELTGAGSTGKTILFERRFEQEIDEATQPQRVTESVELVSSDRIFRHRQRRALDSFDYRVTSGDLRTPWYQATVVPRPRVKNVRLVVTPPEYSKLPPKTYGRMPNRLTVIEGSAVEFIASVDGDAQIAMLHIEDATPRTLFERQPGQFATSMQIDQETKISIEVTEPHGLKNTKQPKGHFLTRPDLPPSVRLHSPSADQKVRPDDVVELKFTAKDDIGLARARVVIQVENETQPDADAAANPEPMVLDTIDIPVPTNTKAGDKPLTKWNGRTKLDLSKYELKEGQTLSYRVEVFDTKQAEILEALENNSADGDPASEPNSPSESNSMADGQPQSSGEPSPGNDAEAADNESSDTDSSDQTATGNSKASGDPMSDNDENESASQTPPGEGPTSETQNTLQSPGSSSADQDTDTNPPSSSQSSSSQSSSSQSSSSQSSSSQSSSSQSSSANPGSSEHKSQESESRSTETEPNLDDQNAPTETDEDPAAQSPSPSGASSSSQNSDSQPSPPSGQPPNPMNTRSLDLPQPSSSQSQRLRVTETVGSFVSQSRQKSEVAIAQTFREVEALLHSARDSLAGVLQSHRDEGEAWTGAHAVAVARSHQDLDHATDSIKALIARTKETPYAFIGLQLAEIAHTHIIPARKDAKSVEASLGETRLALITASRQQVVRALERLQGLYKTYEKAKKDFDVAKSVQEVEKLYRVYLEDALAELQRAAREGDGTPGLERTMAELELDEEYLKRLQEVLEMQRDLRAELAKILADDPRLMRRYFQNFGNGGRSIRDQLYDLAKEQRGNFDVASEYRESLESKDESALSVTVAKHAQTLSIDAMDLVERSLEIEETFETWLPLDDKETPSIRSARESFLGIAAAAGDVTTAFETDVAGELFAGSTSIELEAITTLLNNSAGAVASLAKAIDSASATLAEMADGEPELVENATRRMIELQQAHAAAARWQTTAKMIAGRNYAAAVGVAQVHTTNRTHDLTEKLTGLQRELARQLNPDTNTLPQSIASACDRLLQQLDQEIEPLQLASIRALQQSNLPRATQRLETAANSFDEACKLADELLQGVIQLLDEMPPDPLADLLDDPTLDEILARLEEERQLSETLGIPARPTNLQVVNDWANGTNGPGGAARSRLMRLIQQAMQSQKKKQLKRLAGLRKQLLARHTQEANEIDERSDGNGSVFGWNVLRSRLSTGLLQESDGLPPETYRRSIDRYFEIISNMEAE